ncbi:arsenate reductase ArsC [Loktanella sp. S4079]|uniref:arsenate reductase ArsC n=1 Tax=Loktanella sp. S4079 TaxID=579483 RepID=UPI0005FA0D98|nr:arsenate reductase ArsC [Loktanella sp. S4079]KJZ20173.1 arsenate reductase [Loktanella sp. S4079]
MNILVLCTGNSARSILLESILSHRSNGRIRAWSAGSKPAGKVHPQSLTLLAEHGFPTDGLKSQSWDDFATDDAPKMDAVITVCGSAAAEECPYWPGAPVRAHWGVEDPAAATPDDWKNAFEAAYAQLDARAQSLFALPFETFSQSELHAALNKIGADHA